VDFVTKPSGEVSSDISRVTPELTARLINAAQADMVNLKQTLAPPQPKVSALKKPVAQPFGRRVVVIGVSTGGPAALAQLLPEFSRRTHLAFVIVQHMPATFTKALADRLDALSSIRVVEARDGVQVREGEALLAPGGSHLEFASNGSVKLTHTPPVNGCRPSADVSMRSAAAVFGRNVTGVVMTGMGRDGAQGMAAIKRAGGRTLAQNKETCVIFGMPRACIEQGTVDEVLPLDALAESIGRGE
jgi:two-component system chemotaxis response regulator CheB